MSILDVFFGRMDHKGEDEDPVYEDCKEKLKWKEDSILITTIVITFVVAAISLSSLISSECFTKKDTCHFFKTCVTLALLSLVPLLHLCAMLIVNSGYETLATIIFVVVFDLIRLFVGITAINSPGDLELTKTDKRNIRWHNFYKRTLTPRDTYQDFAKNISYPFLMFVLQLILSCIYIHGVLEEGLPCFKNPRVYVYFLFGVFTKAIYSLSQKDRNQEDYSNYPYDLFASKDLEWWKTTSRELKIGDKTYKHKYLYVDEFSYGTSNKFRVLFIMSFIANTIIFDILFIVINLEMAHSANGVDFVLNFVAALAITEYDNMNYTGEKKINAQIQQDEKIEHQDVDEAVRKEELKNEIRTNTFEEIKDILNADLDEANRDVRRAIQHVKAANKLLTKKTEDGDDKGIAFATKNRDKARELLAAAKKLENEALTDIRLLDELKQTEKLHH